MQRGNPANARPTPCDFPLCATSSTHNTARVNASRALALTLHPFRAWHERPARLGRETAPPSGASRLEVQWSKGELEALLSRAPGALWAAAMGEEPPADLVAVRQVGGIGLVILSRRKALLVSVSAENSSPVGALADLAAAAKGGVESLRRLRRSLEDTTPVLIGPWSAEEIEQARSSADVLTRRLNMIQPDATVRFSRTRVLAWELRQHSRGRAIVLDPAGRSNEAPVEAAPAAILSAVQAHLGEDQVGPINPGERSIETLREGGEILHRFGEHLALRFQLRNEQLVMRFALPREMRDRWLVGRAPAALRQLLLELRRTEIPGTDRAVDLRHHLELVLWTAPGCDADAVIKALAPVLSNIRKVGQALAAGTA